MSQAGEYHRGSVGLSIMRGVWVIHGASDVQASAWIGETTSDAIAALQGAIDFLAKQDRPAGTCTRP